MNLATALRQASKRLETDGIAAPRLTAEVLLCHLLGRGRSYLYAHPEEELSEAALAEYLRLIEQRMAGKPTQYITGRQEFYGREFLVTPDVLIPRPETELVVETALEVGRRAARILEVGCGSGAIAVTLSLETGRPVWATDISAAALAVAARNAHRLGARLHLALCDLTSAIAAGAVDLLVSNPPYVPEGEREGLPREVRDFEPPVALYAGPTGLEAYRRLIADAPRVLRPGGRLVLELGYRALDAVRAMLGGGWRQIQVRHDPAGWPRVLAARYAGEASL